MTSFEIKINGSSEISVSIPDKWNDLTRRQVVEIAAIFHKNSINSASEMLMVYSQLYLMLFLHLPAKVYKKIANFSSRAGLITEEIKPWIGFITKDIRLTNQVIPYFRIWFRKFYGPGNYLGGCTMREFSFAYSLYERYIISSKAEDLDLFIACLYRPGYWFKKHNGSHRKPFKQHQVRDIAKLIKSLSVHEKQAVLLYFRGCLTILREQFPYVFSSSEKGEVKSGRFTFIDVVQNIAGGKFGTFEQTLDSDCLRVLKEINDLKESQTRK